MDTTNRRSSSLPGNSRNDPSSVWVLTDLWTWNGRREGHDINTGLMNLAKGPVKQEIYRRLRNSRSTGAISPIEKSNAT